MTEPSTLEQIVLDAYLLLVKHIEEIDQAMQKQFGIASTFDIRKVRPEDMAYAEQRIHRDGEAVPCRICISEALQEAQVEVSQEEAMKAAQGQQ